MKKENKLKIKIISLGDNVSTRDQCESKFDVVNIRNGKKNHKTVQTLQENEETYTHLLVNHEFD